MAKKSKKDLGSKRGGLEFQQDLPSKQSQSLQKPKQPPIVPNPRNY
jgi:hypothetical protein